MKKVLTIVLFVSMIMAQSLTNLFALSVDTSKVDAAYNKVVSFYEGKTSLESPDEIIAVSTLGLDVSKYQLPDVESIDFEDSDLSLGDLCKSIIALPLMGKDPKDINGVNVVSVLESKVNEDGSIKGSTGSSNDIWMLYALKVVNSSLVDKVADTLSTTNNTDGGFWYSGYGGVKTSDPDTTGWGIEVLSLVDKTKYANSISQAKAFLDTKYNNGVVGDYGDWGLSVDTQSCVLQGLLVNDKAATLQNSGEAFDLLLGEQLSDGSFRVPEYGENYIPTGNYIYNAYATMEAARCLGTYKNGSFVEIANKAYNALSVVNETNDTNNKKPEAYKDEKKQAKPVQTFDNSDITIVMITCGLSLLTIVSLKRFKYE